MMSMMMTESEEFDLFVKLTVNVIIETETTETTLYYSTFNSCCIVINNHSIIQSCTINLFVEKKNWEIIITDHSI